MIFRKLVESDHQQLIDFLRREPEFNLFIIGDIENYGYNSAFQTVWGMVDNDHKVHGVLLKYYNSYLPYTYDSTILKKFAALIGLGAGVISGKKEIIKSLKKFIKNVIIKEESEKIFSHMKCLNSTIKPGASYPIKTAGLKDVDRILEFRSRIKEFSRMPVNREAMVKKIEKGSGRIYYLEDDQGRIISSAATTAENRLSAMIVGVATLEEYRNQGLATSCVYHLCQDMLAINKTPCLFYDNPIAGKIYRKMGFVELGEWIIILFE